MSDHSIIGAKGARTRQRLIDAMLSLVSEGGMPGWVSVRSIARRAGVTEAVLYRYFPNKEAMFHEVWESIQSPMMQAKAALVADVDQDVQDVLHQWIRVTYEQFDADPAAFFYAMLSDATALWRESPDHNKQHNAQTQLFTGWIERHLNQSMTHLTPDRACDYFIALLMAVPRDIRSGALPAPATKYVDQTYQAVARLLGL